MKERFSITFDNFRGDAVIHLKIGWRHLTVPAREFFLELADKLERSDFRELLETYGDEEAGES